MLDWLLVRTRTETIDINLFADQTNDTTYTVDSLSIAAFYGLRSRVGRIEEDVTHTTFLVPGNQVPKYKANTNITTNPPLKNKRIKRKDMNGSESRPSISSFNKPIYFWGVKGCWEI